MTAIANLSYEGELKSGQFGPDTGMYRVFVECYGTMCRLEDHNNETDHWHSRQEAREAAGSRNGHVAIVGVAASNPHYHVRQPGPTLDEDPIPLLEKPAPDCNTASSENTEPRC